MTGAVAVWVAPVAAGTLGTPFFVGHGERAPKEMVRPAWSPVFCDLGGDKIEFDSLFEGEEAFVTVTFTRWNHLVLRACQTRPNGGPTAAGFLGTNGTNAFGDVGSMMMTEGLAYALILQYPYAAKPAMLANALPAGRTYSQAWVVGPDEIPEQGTVARKIVTVWRGLRAYNPLTGSFTLYTDSVPGLPAVPPN